MARVNSVEMCKFIAPYTAHTDAIANQNMRKVILAQKHACWPLRVQIIANTEAIHRCHCFAG